VDDVMHGMRELRDTLRAGIPLEEKFTVRTVGIPEPGKYTPKAVRALREQLGVSQAVFARLLGVSTILAGSWERGNRQPSPLARRLLDTVRANPTAWLETIRGMGGSRRKAG
jgi:putative transcriptional regulator